MFWEKFRYLSEIKGIKPHAILKELEISSGSANNWKKGTIPNGETLKKIADYFDVSIDFLLDSDVNVSVRLSSKKSVLKESSSVPQRFNSLQAVVRTSDEQKPETRSSITTQNAIGKLGSSLNPTNKEFSDAPFCTCAVPLFTPTG